MVVMCENKFMIEVVQKRRPSEGALGYRYERHDQKTHKNEHDRAADGNKAQ